MHRIFTRTHAPVIYINPALIHEFLLGNWVDDDDDDDDEDDDDDGDDDEQIRHKQRARFYRRICNHGVGRGQHRYSTLIFLYAGIFYRE